MAESQARQQHPENGAEPREQEPDDLASDALFKEPDGYYKPEKRPTTAEYTLLEGRTLKLGLVGESPLWVR